MISFNSQLGQHWLKSFVAGTLILSFFIAPGVVLAQEEQAVSDEVAAEVELELQASPEVAKEQNIDLKAELDLPANFDPVVPNNFINSVRYGIKKIGRDVVETTTEIFASEETHAGAVKKHADKELVEAIKLHASNPGSDKVADILDEYKSDLKNASDAVEQIKNKDEKFAKDFAAELAEDHLFIAPKAINSLRDNLFESNPDILQAVTNVKEEALGAAGSAIAMAASNDSEVSETLNIIAEKKFLTPFSGIAAADLLEQSKNNLPQGSKRFSKAFDEAINTSLESTETSFNNLDISDEVKAASFRKFAEQLPGNSIARIKVIEQFKNRSDLSSVLAQNLGEVKARITQNLTKQLEGVADDHVREAMSKAMLEFRNPGIEELKLVGEVGGLVPNERIRKEMKQREEEHVAKFVAKFKDDPNALKVTEEFKAVTAKVQSGEVMPDASFFKTLDNLKKKLSPQQQAYIDEMEQAGRDEMKRRMQDDENFAEKLGSLNPADFEYYEKMKGEFDPGLNSKFEELKKIQGENFRKLLEAQDDPAKVLELERRFETEIPDEVKQRFEQSSKINFEEEFRKHEGLAKEKEKFFQQKREDMEKEYREKFGEDSASHGPFNFQQPNFRGDFNNQSDRSRLIPPACSVGTTKTEFGCELPFEKKDFDPAKACGSRGGIWQDTFCEFKNSEGVPNDNNNQENQNKPEEYCSQKGGKWTGTFCQLPGFQKPQDEGDLPDEAFRRKPEEGGNLPVPEREEFSPEKYCAQKGGTWANNNCSTNQQSREFQPEIGQPNFSGSPDFQANPSSNQQPPPDGFRPEVQGAHIDNPYAWLVKLLSSFRTQY